MDRIGQSASQWLTGLLLAVGCVGAWAQTSPQDGIDRSLLQREQQEREFHVKLYDAPRGDAPRATVTLPLPGSFTERESYERAPDVPPSSNSPVPSASPNSTDRMQLDDSQLRRQLELQTQNKLMSDPSRQQQSQIQQLQFGRENQAQQLQQGIMRDSNSMMQRLR
jgi:hypothetical protein